MRTHTYVEHALAEKVREARRAARRRRAGISRVSAYCFICRAERHFTEGKCDYCAGVLS